MKYPIPTVGQTVLICTRHGDIPAVVSKVNRKTFDIGDRRFSLEDWAEVGAGMRRKTAKPMPGSAPASAAKG